ncbi:hypothetical protein JGUZn3_08810 [Entomobacter blattae]|uniref:Uncharacterized protein n=1 Tax=Entomobacter blattae TaxID=2762277 RepID=A0A7H1NQQ3_9PROT|nr:hypothetical protein JGUZn3_08810 [Entomobacter blattae]
MLGLWLMAYDKIPFLDRDMFPFGNKVIRLFTRFIIFIPACAGNTR